MEMDNYEVLKNHLFLNLQQLEQPLEKGAIEAQIGDLKIQIDLLTNALGFERGLATISPLLKKVNELPNDGEWAQMQNDLEKSFNVRMEDGILIKERDDNDKNTNWWTENSKSQSDLYYWNRYSNELLTILNKQVRNKIDESTDVIMNNIGNPSDKDFEHRGMVVGHVQSGKTANYASLVCKAADAGYKFIVVIAGDKNNLRKQTQERLNDHFVGWNGEKQVGVGIGRDKRDKRPVSLTGLERDFNKRDADRASQVSNFDNVIVPILLVIKKNTRTLTNVTSWLRNQYKNRISDHAMLLIDDESDYASINTRDENSPTRINEKIRELLSLFEKRSYVAYTATPYANILIDHKAYTPTLGADLFPKDFIYALDAPTNYFGAEKLFVENPDKHIIELDDHADIFPSKHKKDLDVFELPPSLKNAIRLFLINVSIRDLRGHTKKHNSMMIHCSRFTNVHQQIKFRAQEYIDKIKKDILSYGNLNDSEQYSKNVLQLKDTYQTYYKDIEFSWKNVKKQMVKNIETIIVREVHQKTPPHLRLSYEDSARTNAIVIGGASISRGYTLEGLSISYFLRNTIYYDTLMQMGRWFGYRPGYDDLCKIFIPREVKDNFTDIIEATIELFEDFRRMADDNMTPKEFGLAIQYRPESALQVTARNKQRNAEDLIIEMKLDGLSKETARIHLDKVINRKNKEEIRRLLEIIGPQTKIVGKTYLWQYVPKTVILRFLNNYKFINYEQYTLNMRMPIEFIKEYVSETNTLWDVALYNGQGEIETGLPNNINIRREQRRIEKLDKSNKHFEILRRQVSSGNAENVVLSESEKNELRETGRKLTRNAVRNKMPRPLLMLHFLEIVDGNFDKKFSYPAIGFSFPTYLNGAKESIWKEPIRLKINSVYAQQLQEELEYEGDSDDY